jgi:hypothetical protein
LESIYPTPSSSNSSSQKPKDSQKEAKERRTGRTMAAGGGLLEGTGYYEFWLCDHSHIVMVHSHSCGWS